VAEVGVEGAVAGDEGDAAPAVVLVGEALDAALAEVAATDDGADGVVGDAEALGHLGDQVVGEVGFDGAVEVMEEGDVDLDGVGLEVGGGVVGDHGGAHGGEAAVVGAEGDGPFAQGALEAGGVAAGEAGLELVGVGVEVGFEVVPGGQEDFP
jgi:hypothetical protein